MTINLNTMARTGAYHGDQRAMLPVYDSGSETGNLVLTMDHPMRELFITNDTTDETSMTVNVSGAASLSLTFVLRQAESLNERFPEFETVTVTSSSNWRWYVRSGRVT